MFVDASAIVAILGREPEGDRLGEALANAPAASTSAIAIWEAAVALARHGPIDPLAALADVRELIAKMGMTEVAIGAEEAQLAVDAFTRYGKGRHPAKLNMGDCFAYACAKAHGAPLLYKGADFALTDISAA